jgi:hypothetical protein
MNVFLLTPKLLLGVVSFREFGARNRTGTDVPVHHRVSG